MNSALFSLQVSTVCTVRLVYIIFLSSPNGLYSSYKKFPLTVQLTRECNAVLVIL